MNYENFKERLKAIPILSPNVPMAYGEYMTYIEQVYAIYDVTIDLIKLTEELNTKVDNFELNFQNLQDQIDTHSTEINQLYYDFNVFRNEINQLLDQRLSDIRNQLLVLLSQYQDSINASFNEYKNTVDSELEEFNNTIDTIIRLGDINAYDPTTGEMNNLNMVLSNIYGALRQNALTVAEFENLDLTCTEYDIQEVTAYNFDVNGKTFVHPAN